MFCTTCGYELPEGAKFCTSCGTPVDNGAEAADAAAGTAADAAAASATATHTATPDMPEGASTGHASPQAPGQENAPKSKRTVLVAIVAGVVVVAAIVFALFHFGLLGGGTKATFGQADALQCSVVTRIRPRNADGSDFTSYAVKLVEGTSSRIQSLGASDDLDGVVSEIRVTGNNGFTMSDFGDDLSDGDYVLVFVLVDASDDDASYDRYIDIHYEYDNEDSHDDYVIVPPAPEDADGDGQHADGGFTEEQLAYAAYYQKCQELIDRYGAPESVDLYDGQMTATGGLALVTLVDFDGDGLDELLVSYCTTHLDDQGFLTITNETYLVEVWDYQDGSLVQVYEGEAEHSNGGAFYVDLYARDGRPMLHASWFDSPNTDTEGYREVFLIQEESSFSPAGEGYWDANHVTGEQTVAYKVDGSEVSEEEWNSFLSSLTHTDHFDLIAFNNSSDADGLDDGCRVLGDSSLVKETEDTIEALRTGAGSALDAASEGDGANESDASVSYASESIEEAVSYTSSQGPGLTWDATASWCYPRFTRSDGSTTAALDTLNAQFKSAYDADVENAHTWTFGSDESQVQVHRDTVTYLNGSYACVRSDRSTFGGGVHGYETVTGAFYDLKTGAQVPIETALGVPFDELKSEAKTVVLNYIASQPDGYLIATDEATLDELITESRFYADEQGIVVALWPYEIGSYADGTQLIYVRTFEDSSLVGTNAGMFDWGD